MICFYHQTDFLYSATYGDKTPKFLNVPNTESSQSRHTFRILLYEVKQPIF